MNLVEWISSSKWRLLFVFIILTMILFVPVHYFIEYYYVNQVCGCQMELVVPTLVLISGVSTSGLVSIAILFGILLIEKREKQRYGILAGLVGARDRDFNTILDRLLSEKEKSVLRALASMGGRGRQADIVQETGLSRVDVHRVLSVLEERGMVTREKEGRTMMVHLDPLLVNFFSGKRGEDE